MIPFRTQMAASTATQNLIYPSPYQLAFDGRTVLTMAHDDWGEFDTSTFAISIWVERTKLNTTQAIYTKGDGSSTGSSFALNFTSSNQLNVSLYGGGSHIGRLKTSRTFVEKDKLTHLLVRVDIRQPDPINRLQIWIDAIRETDFATSTVPSQAIDPMPSKEVRLGGFDSSKPKYFHGSLYQPLFFSGHWPDPVDLFQLKPIPAAHVHSALEVQETNVRVWDVARGTEWEVAVSS